MTTLLQVPADNLLICEYSLDDLKAIHSLLAAKVSTAHAHFVSRDNLAHERQQWEGVLNRTLRQRNMAWTLISHATH